MDTLIATVILILTFLAGAIFYRFLDKHIAIDYIIEKIYNKITCLTTGKHEYHVSQVVHKNKSYEVKRCLKCRKAVYWEILPDGTHEYKGKLK